MDSVTTGSKGIFVVLHPNDRMQYMLLNTNRAGAIALLAKVMQRTAEALNPTSSNSPVPALRGIDGVDARRAGSQNRRGFDDRRTLFYFFPEAQGSGRPRHPRLERKPVKHRRGRQFDITRQPQRCECANGEPRRVELEPPQPVTR